MSHANNYVITQCVAGILNIEKRNLDFTLTPSNSSVILGDIQTFNFTATAIPSATGSVRVSDGINSCSASLALGTCQFTASSAGTKTLTAMYAGDVNYNASTATALLNVAQVIFSQTQLNLAENGSAASYTVKLATPPANPITLNLTPDAQITLSPTTLLFTPANWNTPQTVTVSAIDDSIYENTHTGVIRTAITTGDNAAYPSTSQIAIVSAQIIDNDNAPITPIPFYELTLRATGTGSGILRHTCRKLCTRQSYCVKCTACF